MQSNNDNQCQQSYLRHSLTYVFEESVPRMFLRVRLDCSLRGQIPHLSFGFEDDNDRNFDNVTDLICTFISPSADPVTNMVSLLSMAIHFTLNFCLVYGIEIFIGINHNEKSLSLNIFGSTTLPHAHGRGMCGAVSLASSPKGTPMCLRISSKPVM